MFKYTPSKDTFWKLLSKLFSKLLPQNCSLKNFFLKFLPPKKTFSTFSTFYFLKEHPDTSWLLLTSMIRDHPMDFFVVKIYNFITMRFYFSFQNKIIIDRLAIKFFFISALTLFQTLLYFSKVIIFNQKIHPFSFSIIIFYISVCFRM